MKAEYTAKPGQVEKVQYIAKSFEVSHDRVLKLVKPSILLPL